MRLCFECAEPIHPKRLSALPNTHTCIACQKQHDIEVMREAAIDIARLAPRRPKPVVSGLSTEGLAALLGRPVQVSEKRQRVVSLAGMQAWTENGKRTDYR